jgi:hypothetical protein
MSGREPGFYWVRELKVWRIGEWIAGRSPDGRLNKWRLHGQEFHEPDRAFEEIAAAIPNGKMGRSAARGRAA